MIKLFLTIAFEYLEKTLVGKVLIPRNIENNDQILYSIKSEIDVYKGKHLPQIQITNSLIGQKFNLNNIKYTINNTFIPVGEAL